MLSEVGRCSCAGSLAGNLVQYGKLVADVMLHCLSLCYLSVLILTGVTPKLLLDVGPSTAGAGLVPEAGTTFLMPIINFGH